MKRLRISNPMAVAAFYSPLLDQVIEVIPESGQTDAEAIMEEKRKHKASGQPHITREGAPKEDSS